MTPPPTLHPGGQTEPLLAALRRAGELSCRAVDLADLARTTCETLLQGGLTLVALARLAPTLPEPVLVACRDAHAAAVTGRGPADSWSDCGRLASERSWQRQWPCNWRGRTHGLLLIGGDEADSAALPPRVVDALDTLAATLGAILALHYCEEESIRLRHALDRGDRTTGKGETTAEEQLRLKTRALESSLNGVMITSAVLLDHPITYVNPAFERITGYRADEVIGKAGRFLVRDDLNQRGLNEIRAALRDKREGHAIVRNYRRDGSLFWNELHIAPVRDESGTHTTHFVSIITDVTERVRYQEQLEYQAHHDVLTGLANRALLADRISQAIAQARRDKSQVAVLLLDLDRFKLVNDGLGHGPADELLKTVAARLMACVRDTDTVARLGGDEFVIVVRDIRHPEDAAGVADKVLKSLALPFTIADKEVFIGASIGISLYPRDGDHDEILMRNADVAMYRVKEHGRNSYRFFLPEMGGMALGKLDMEGNLRRALENGELVPYYQPKVNIATGRIVGAEALVRWRHPKIGVVSPNEFIPLAEETGLILPLGEQMLAQVCRQIRCWDDTGLPRIPVAVNISARQFRQDDLAQRIRYAIEESGLDPARLELELTESMVMHDADGAIGTLRELRLMGLQLSLDDFGTGYSNLTYLKRFPINTLKIDRSFVSDLTTNPDDAAIAAAVVAMAHQLGLTVVAEGVETAEQLQLLAANGCDQYQGFLFSRPVPAEDFGELLRRDQQQA